jgi:glycosyltransferase involved in cell wall biosynthesis
MLRTWRDLMLLRAIGVLRPLQAPVRPAPRARTAARTAARSAAEPALARSARAGRARWLPSRRRREHSVAGAARGRPRLPHVAMLECDVAAGIVPVAAVDRDGAPWTSVELLVRMFTEPIGALSLAIGPEGLGVEAIAAALTVQLGAAIASRMRSAGVPWSGVVPIQGLTAAAAPPYLASRERAKAQAPSMTVAVCTRNRPEGLATLLDSLVEQEHDAFDVLIVDNAPDDDRTRVVAERYANRLQVAYVVEPRPGLSRARNRAVAESHGEVLAWLDDDETCDPWWTAEIARGFVEHPQAGGVCGMTLAAEIETPAQAHFEAYGGHRKGRGFTPAVFSPATRSQQSPLYPLPPFGAGCNMALRRSTLERIGGFDPALGAGTSTGGAEDTAALSAALWLGGTLVYQPTAITRHVHRREDAALHGLFENYGSGLSAYYTSMVLRYPRCSLEMLRLAPRALRDLTASDGARLGDVADAFPRELLRAHRHGLLRGPARYLSARAAARRTAEQGAPAR